MVSMRYARNPAAGEGLVRNSGPERVEGFTRPHWTGVMAPVRLRERGLHSRKGSERIAWRPD
jgi:hypothetical protein